MNTTGNDFFSLAKAAGLALERNVVMPWLSNRGHLNAASTRLDFVFRKRNLIVEVDELQHFTSERLATLEVYPTDAALAFDAERYRADIKRWRRGYLSMIIERRQRAFSSYLTRLLSEGRLVFSREQARKELGIGDGALLDAAERQQRQGHLITPRRGFYVIVPPQYLTLGAPPPSFYIDSLMRHEGCTYYVGLLKAAELHGAAHQAVMQFQVVTDKRLPKIKAGRSAIVFYYRKEMNAIAIGLQDRKTDTGYFKISSVELTMLDLLRYPHAGAGLDNVATIFSELAERVDAQKLATLSASFERAVVQRLGYMLDTLGHGQRTEPLREALKRCASLPWVELQPARASDRGLTPDAAERSERWRVIVRRALEPDE